METSILNTTKKILGISADYTAFDVDIITHINTALATVYQLGLSPTEAFSIEDETAVWADLGFTPDQTSMVRTYVYLKVRLLFDPPTTSFLLQAMENQVREYEWRMNVSREEILYPLSEEEVG